MKIRLSAPLQADSIVDGPGIRAVIWTQGCGHKCPGCHNPETHSFKAGFLKDIEELKQEIDDCSLIDGITLSGGDPFFQPEASLELAKYAKEKGLNVWAYSGFTFEELLLISKTKKVMRDLLENIDVLVDGKFVLEKKSLELNFRGSTNQRIVNVEKSLKQEKVCTIKKYDRNRIKKPKYSHLYV